MAKIDITASNGSLILKRTPVMGDVLPKTITFRQPSIVVANGKIKFYESGDYSTSLLFSNLGTIDGNTPTDILDAEDMILALMSSIGGGGGGSSTSYNTPTVYDTPGDLPITFDADTIHAISILCLTGTLTCTINGEEVIYAIGEGTDIEADGLIDQEISIDSTTGTFLISTVN